MRPRGSWWSETQDKSVKRDLTYMEKRPNIQRKETSDSSVKISMRFWRSSSAIIAQVLRGMVDSSTAEVGE